MQVSQCRHETHPSPLLSTSLSPSVLAPRIDPAPHLLLLLDMERMLQLRREVVCLAVGHPAKLSEDTVSSERTGKQSRSNLYSETR